MKGKHGYSGMALESESWISLTKYIVNLVVEHIAVLQNQSTHNTCILAQLSQTLEREIPRTCRAILGMSPTNDKPLCYNF
jgi:hypothetical protein